MALIEYATDEITQQVLWFCDCGDMTRVIGNHGGGRGCAIFPVVEITYPRGTAELLDRKRAERANRALDNGEAAGTS